MGLALWLISQGAQALVLRNGEGLSEPVSLMGETEVFRDASGNITIEEILSGRHGIEFIAKHKQDRQQYSGDVFWIRFSLQREPDAPSEWAVHIFPSWVDDVRVYSQDAAGQISVDQLGDRQPFASRTLRTSMMAFPVSVDASPRTYYVRVKTHGLAPLCLHVWQKAGLERTEINRIAFLSAFAGAICIMVLMNLIFWVWLRSSVYPIYALFLVSMLVAIASMLGYASSLFFPGESLSADRFVDASSCALMAMAAVFVWRFFDYDRYSPWSARFMKSAAVAFAAMAVLSTWGVDSAIHAAVCLQFIVGLFNLAFFAWLMVRHRAFQYLLAASVFTAVNLSWTFYLLVLLGLVSMEQPFVLEFWIPMLQLANLALLNFAVASQSRQAVLKLREERKRAFNSMKVAKIALEEKVRQREFVAVVSHEFRTPLAVVDAVAHALELSPSGRDEGVKRAVEKIRKATRRLATLIENILHDDALEVGSVSRPLQRSFDLRDVIENVRGIGLPEENARLSIDSTPGRAMCIGDQAGIEMAIRNLVQNALKYSPADSVVSVRCEAGGGLFSVTVSNRGAPIPDSERSNLFERYFRGVTSAQVPGSGLGLHISRTIARQHGGEVELLSSDAGGTVFCLKVPLEPNRRSNPLAVGQPRTSSAEAASVPVLKV